MSRASRIVALIVAIAFVAVGMLFMIQRIGAVIGWDKASGAWPVIAILAGLILFVAFLVYMTVRNKLSR
jgi:divalent metal cation (Fe/Co/Zn/Cd) transporter